MHRTAPPAAAPGDPRGPRNGLGAVTFAVVLLGAVLAVVPATAGFGFLLCLTALVPAFLAHRRTRKGTATNPGRSFAALLMAPVFLVVALVVGVAAAPAPVRPASDTTALASVPVPAAAAVPTPPLVAPAPAPVEAPPVEEPAAEQAPVAAPPSSARASRATAPRPVPARHAAAPAPAVRKLPASPASPEPVARPTPRPTLPPAPTPAARAPKPKPEPEPEPAPVARPAPSTDRPPSCDTSTHYVNSGGDCVPDPDSGGSGTPTAQCKDGTYSYSEHRSGTCSGHRGVATWL